MRIGAIVVVVAGLVLGLGSASTNPNAILSVFLTSSNSFMFNLDNNGNGRYSARRRRSSTR